MRKSLRRLTHSLAGRMALAVFASVALALVVGTASSLWQEVDRYAAAKRDALAVTGEVFASATARATFENDTRSANETLRAIARRPELVYTAIERPDGSTLADQGLTIRLASDLDLDHTVSALDLLTTRTAQVRVPIVHQGSVVGTLVLVADTSDLFARLLAIVEASAYGSAVALALGLVVSWAMQRSITQPIAALAGTMERVRTDQDYSRVARIARDDEVGVLAATFNSLLGTVRERDARLARHRDSLERDVADRTADLLEAKDAAEAANGAKSAFLATMSHEIRTPLNGMLVLAELLAGADLPQRQRRHAEVIARSGQTLLSIINDILDFAKVEAGRIDLEAIPVSPAEVADTVVSLFSEKAREKGLDLAAYVSPDLPAHITGDPVRLGQILGNFVNNALKFTERGSVLVRIAPSPGGLGLSVRDTGIGIAAEARDSIFSAFSQADQSTTRRYGGTGLGLSIAQRLVAAMGGTIGVDSEVGTGSTFWAQIPLPAAAGTEAAPPLAPGARGAVAVTLAPGATREVLCERLAQAGFALVSAEAAGEADRFVDARALLASGTRPGPGRIVAVAGLDEVSATTLTNAGLADAVLRWPLVQDDLAVVLAVLATDAAFDRSERRPRRSDGTWPRFPHARVLVADDSAVNREVAIEALARFGITLIETVNDGREAVAACQAGPYDLVLMDGSMPVLDGYDASRAIRRWESEHGVARMPIVAATAHVVGSAANVWREAGMDATLTKPFTLQALSEVLSRLLTPGAAVADGGDVEPVPAVQEPDAVLDEDTIANLEEMGRVSDGAFARRVVAIFTEHAPAAIAQLREATAAADGEAAARAAHSLKSMSLNVGGRALARALASIEEEARGRAICPSPEAIDAVADLLAVTVTGLEARFPAPLPVAEGLALAS
ncbi:ATP-binding protein [Methylobacterium sp. Leaf466]|uniref:ATP-binding protein n=1 Tax=Methylobacterium sp. Leaf466 TaxID=1736386 RepID=UPI0007017546|nr:ATP-binding protein [Methylobacterium sp. Leaf466]KQT88678.1 ATPase [Methylobacterium sp. Leaf466]